MQRAFAADLRGVFAGVCADFCADFYCGFLCPRFWGVAWCCIDLDVERGDMAIVYKNGINVSPSHYYDTYQNVSRETFWYDCGQKPYKASDSGPFFDHVRLIDLLVQFEKRRGGASMP
ncbi:MAG: hypothetical protein WBW81_02070 [Methylocella sp.]